MFAALYSPIPKPRLDCATARLTDGTVRWQDPQPPLSFSLSVLADSEICEELTVDSKVCEVIDMTVLADSISPLVVEVNLMLLTTTDGYVLKRFDSKVIEG
ncbi:unnamed protein product [Citrullus colocynthis]|uniref:Uncharacterized protein n=1 Tax=Citrullus colocynthis TaxID=252529 RepID=A0ABP0Z3R6_9ROSI